MGQKMLIDQHKRHIHKLRISLLDACNMRCLYCMPEKNKFMPRRDWLKSDELIDICSNLVNFGIDEIRVTGGEPLLRSDFLHIINGLSELKLEKLGLTTNAIRLKQYLPELQKTNCKHINISLDSIDRDNFKKITKTDALLPILDAILKAKELDFKVKINTVLMKGINDHEVIDLIKFAEKNEIEIRFLELMNIGVVAPYFEKVFISAEDIIKKVETNWQLKKIEMPFDSTSFNFRTQNGGNVGFIASESKPFCSGCSRLRLDPKGKLRPCLMVNEGVNLKGLKESELKGVLDKLINKKPTYRLKNLEQPMYQIGG